MPLSTTARSPAHAANTDTSRTAPRAVAIWLFCCCGLILLMVMVGGITRLTLSGLSITEWDPIIGVVPPLTSAQWTAEFARYQKVPEYRALQYGMSLADFKTIFFWEYTHRLLGRLIGFAFAVPLVLFWVRGRLPRGLAPALAGILALGLAQGLVGWYMVESGLVHRVDVSQYRLVTHLALALLIYSLVLWTGLGLAFPFEQPGPLYFAVSARGIRGEKKRGLRCDGPTPISPSWRRAGEALIALIGLTIAAGGFVAGTRAGFTYNTFPLMDGRLAPAAYAELTPLWRNWFENVAAVQFDHRVLAITTAAAVVLLVLAGLPSRLPAASRAALWALLAIVVLQVALGISTLLLVVPIPLAVAHQGDAVIMLSAALVFRHTLRQPAIMDAKSDAAV